MTQTALMPEWMLRRLAGNDESPGEIEVPPDEAQSAQLFLVLDTQWHRHGMTGVRLGMMYDAIEPTARLAGIAVTPAIFADLQVMESAALVALAERQTKR